MVEVNGDNYNKCKKITDEIDALLEKIKDDTMCSSSHSATTEHENFKKLVAMGDRTIPYLFHLMTQYGCNWTHILLMFELKGNEIHIPEEHYGGYYHIFADWMQWYIKSPYVNHESYYGLL